MNSYTSDRIVYPELGQYIVSKKQSVMRNQLPIHVALVHLTTNPVKIQAFFTSTDSFNMFTYLKQCRPTFTVANVDMILITMVRIRCCPLMLCPLCENFWFRWSGCANLN